ncbi:SDR family oxidoreductase (plasmid) [Rhizobium sp. CC1099]|uniref:SDR family NAD(P)-dependent oxidoreductase n=1 Tax=Rhizobium sp. CC1099 TaxID=3039160 RepID=UPI0024B05D86|nr:SDR family oxidoreductase [Rhizobium sp. CC1099]WFU91361.1 SDR family oxidoreductase [Rhizobium sp. CC1099]
MTIQLPVTPSFRLDGRRALVTGAGGGLGLAASTALASAGATVTLCDFNADGVGRVADTMREAGLAVETLVLDVTDLDAVRGAIFSAPAFNVFVNNAGTNRPGPFVEASPDNFDLMMNLNVRAAYFTAQAVAQRMIAAGIAGSIINMSSQMGHVGSAGRSLYCATKWAMEGFSRCMALELAEHQIRVNTLCPTFIETPMTKPFFENAEFKKDVLSRIKLGRLGKVEDLMAPIVFLASDASALMTGSALMLDGGWTAD